MNYGADNLWKPLKSVILAKPEYYSIPEPINQWQEKFRGTEDRELARSQHEGLVRTLKDNGVQCHFLEPVKGATEQKDVRDIGIISSKGAIAGHFAKDIRMGEVASFILFCVENKIPLLKYGIPFEGGDLFLVDEEHCYIGSGKRSSTRPNELESLLNRKVHIVHHISSHHLDAIFNFARPDLIVLHPKYIAEEEIVKGKDVIEMDDNDIWLMSANFLLLDKDKVLADSQCKRINNELSKRGIEVVEIDVSELKKNGGSIRCMTLPLLRE